MKQLFIDADNFPQLAVSWLADEAAKLKLPLYLVANHFSRPMSYGRQITTSSQKESADNYIITHITEEDLVFTLDLLLAQKLEEKKVLAVNHLGEQLRSELLKKKLLERNLMLNLGENAKNLRPKQKSYGPKELNNFKERCIPLLKTF
ncbi:MAG: DUF188 domain-containing protein [Spirochaetaceae bacterium]|nr:DUF188 domain-containing protein [Spirochaetaceae bacterium]